AILFVQDDDDKFVWQSYATGPVWALGVSEVTDLGLSLYPNPAATSFNVTFSGESNSASVRIIDMNGKEVLNQSISNLNGSVNCDFLQNGLYFVELNANGKTAVKKLNIIR
ncbi:MAG: T9SS type A sorting domain-containing protein, partial [Bacteroidia bacterium]|nr:T9SS type A sorting domain-containing protein [Bacteroidia bacterium]